MSEGMRALLRPRSIAVVGASDDPTRIGGRPIAFSLAAGFQGAIYPVNPNRETVQGLRAYRVLSDLPGEIDLAVIAVPAADVETAVLAAAARGARCAIVFSSGFSEAGATGAALQARLADAARDAGMRLLGPNCVGMFNAAIGHVATFSSAPEAGLSPGGRVGLMSQSGAYGTHLLTKARARRIAVGQWVSTGNEADIAAADVIHAFALDPDIAVIAAYLEGVKDGPSLLRALAAAHDAGKPVVLMKVGRSAAGAAAAAAHTAALAGQDAVFDAAIADYGVVRVDSTDEMLDLVYGASRAPLPRGSGRGVRSSTGGAGVMIADAAEGEGLTLPPMPDTAQRILLDRVPFASAANPVDITAQAMNDFSLVELFLDQLLRAGDYASFVAFFTTWGGSPVLGPRLRAALRHGSAALGDRPMALVLLADDAIAADYEADGFLVFDDPTRAVQVLGRMARLGQGLARRYAAGPPVLSAVPPFPGERISESEGKAILREIGIAVLPEALAASAEEARVAAETFAVPVAMKLVSPDVAHKTEVGGVKLDVTGGGAAALAWQQITDSARAHVPDARIHGVSVVPMAGWGVELIVGIRADPVFGLVTIVGMGGVLVEVMKDVAMRIGRVDRAGALDMLRSLRGFPLLAGVRGQPGCDLDAVADAIVRLSEYAAAHASMVGTIEINPLLARVGDAVALDMLIEPRAQG